MNDISQYLSIAYLAAAAFLRWYLSLPPGKCYRIDGIEDARNLPDICVITGDAATERHVVSLTQTNHIFFFESIRASLPFSEAGWARYRKTRPISMRIYHRGIKMFGIIWFVAYVFTFFPLIAIVDLILKKRELIKLSCPSGSVYNTFSLTVANEQIFTALTKSQDFSSGS